MHVKKQDYDLIQEIGEEYVTHYPVIKQESDDPEVQDDEGFLIITNLKLFYISGQVIDNEGLISDDKNITKTLQIPEQFDVH